MTARTSGADKGNPTVQSPSGASRKNSLFNLPFNAVRIRGMSSWSESMAYEKYEQIMLRLLVPVVFAVCTWKPEADR